MKKFDEGILFACALMNRLHDEPTIAGDTISESGLKDADCSKMDEFEKEQLRLIQDANHRKLNLTF